MYPYWSSAMHGDLRTYFPYMHHSDLLHLHGGSIIIHINIRSSVLYEVSVR